MTDALRLLAAMEAGWPPVATWREGPWRLRDGQGGGGRVSAATAEAPVSDADVAALSRRPAPPEVMVREGEAALDALLAAAGWSLGDPTCLYLGRAAQLAGDAAGVAELDVPDARLRALWQEGGIGAARLAVMARGAAPKAILAIEVEGHAAGAAYVAARDGTAFVHAVHVRPEMRRAGLGGRLLGAAARWAEARGATGLGLAVTEANAPARALYARAGLVPVTRYHYRRPPAVGS